MTHRDPSRRRFAPWARVLLFAPLLAVLALDITSRAAEAAVTIDRETRIFIERHGPASEALTLATDLLQKYLASATRRSSDGAATEVPATGAAASSPTVTFIVSSDALVWHQLPPEKRSNLRDLDAFTITIAERETPTVTIHAGTVFGAVCGVLDFLETEIGVTWLFPGDLGVALPETDRFVLQPGSRRSGPDVTSRLYTGLVYPDPAIRQAFRVQWGDTPLMDERHFFASYEYFKSLRLHFLASPSHNMINIFPAAMLKQQAPQVLPMLPDGSRFAPGPQDNEQAWHPCYTTPKAAEIAIAAARKAFDSGAMCFSMGINDGRRVQCQCDTCKAVGWPMSYYNFVTIVANAVRDDYPGHLLGVLVYGDVRHPPADMRLPDNVLAMVSGNSRLEDWSRHAHHIGRYDWAYGKGFVTPSFPLTAMIHNAGIFKQYGVRSYRAEVHPIWAFDGPKVYILSKQLWNLDMDPDAALSRWCDAGFGAAGPVIKAYYLRWAGLADYLAADRGNEPAPMCDMNRWRNTSAQFSSISPEDFAFCAAQLDEAARLVKPGPQAQRLDMVRTYFDHAHTWYRLYDEVQSVFAAEAADGELPKLFDRIAALESQAVKLEAKIAAHPEWRTGADKDSDVEDYFTIEHEIHSGAITALMQLREQGRAPKPRDLPEWLAPYATGKIAPGDPVQIKLMDRGHYWHGEHVQHLFEPLAATNEDGATIRVKLGDDLPVIADGAQAGQYEQHYSFSLVPYQKDAYHRVLYRVEIRATGQDGMLNISLANPWPRKDDDHLPVTVAIPLDDASRPTKRVLYIEPIGLASPMKLSAFAYRLQVLFSPEAATAELDATIHIRAVLLPVEDLSLGL